MKLKHVKYINYEDKEVESFCNLTIGKEYIALCISFSDPMLVYIEHDDGQAGFENIKSFEILSTFIPSSWVLDYKPEFRTARLYPKAWIDADNFWERFVDDEDPEMVDLYCQERDKIYSEEPK